MFLTISHGLLLIGFLLPAAGVGIEAATPAGTCPNGTLEDSTNHLCFKFVRGRKSFFDADNDCYGLGGHLAVVDTDFTNTFLASNAGDLNSDDFWIGAHVFSTFPYKPWIWTDSHKLVIYNDWAKGQPSGGETSGDQCAAASVLDGTWNAVDCSLTKPYVCGVPRIVYNCPSEWTYFNVTQSCYKTFFRADWQNAESVCVSNGAHLASIHRQEENDFVANFAHEGDFRGRGNNSEMTWIGLFTTTDDNSVWQWSDGSPVDYINWAPEEPNFPGEEKCVELYYDLNDMIVDNHFNNYPCQMILRNYVCKKKADVLSVI